MLVKVLQVLRQGRLWQQSPCPNVMVGDIDHAKLWLHLHLSWEQGHVLVQQILTTWSSRVIDKDYTVSIFLDWTPALFVLHVP